MVTESGHKQSKVQGTARLYRVKSITHLWEQQHITYGGLSSQEHH